LILFLANVTVLLEVLLLRMVSLMSILLMLESRRFLLSTAKHNRKLCDRKQGGRLFSQTGDWLHDGFLSVLWLLVHWRAGWILGEP
jgi:hypothetical protein